MNLFKLSYAYLKRRALNTFLNVLLLAFGIGTVTILLLFSYQMEENLYNNAQGIDVVVGAKGSPIQLILSGIFHADSPTGNIRLSEAKELMDHRMVRTAIPLALGDNYKGYRIVGTTKDYQDHYGVSIGEGMMWDHEFEVVIGYDIAQRENLKIGDEIVSSHGLSDGGAGHDEHELVVVGIFEKSGSVLDRLILTAVETMWGLHTYSVTDAESDHSDDHNHVDNNQATDDGHYHGHGREISPDSYLSSEFDNEEITAMLIKYTSPLGAAQFPRFVNSQTSMQAAAPAYEITRLLNILGVGLDAIQIFGYILIFAAILGIFIALLNSMKERKYDLAIMRTLGASRTRLFTHIILEGVIIALLGSVLGMLLGHAAIEGIGIWMAQAQQFTISGYVIAPGELYLIILAVAVGIVAAFIPAIQAYRTEISHTLSKI
jgi:putative ABC transport system permease protein